MNGFTPPNTLAWRSLTEDANLRTVPKLKVTRPEGPPCWRDPTTSPLDSSPCTECSCRRGCEVSA